MLGRAAVEGPSTSVTASCVENLDGVPGSWFRPSPALTAVDILADQRFFFSPSLSLFLLTLSLRSTHQSLSGLKREEVGVNKI